jgi:hypothetical protein
MPRDLCPHYPNSAAPTADGVSRCRACGEVMYQSPVNEGQPKAQYSGTTAAAGTALNAASKGSKIDGKQH